MFGGVPAPHQSDTSVLVASAATWSDRGVQTSLALARAQLRHGWRNLVGIVVLVALIGGLVLAGLAGAQRTRTAVDRMIEQNEVSDVLVNPNKGGDTALDFDLVAALADGRRVLPERGRGQLAVRRDHDGERRSRHRGTIATDGHALVDFDRPVMSAGRVPDPDAPDEVYVDRTYAAAEGIEVGDLIGITVLPVDVLGAAFEVVRRR